MNTLQLQFLMWIFAGWVNRSQQDVIQYLQELGVLGVPIGCMWRAASITDSSPGGS